MPNYKPRPTFEVALLLQVLDPPEVVPHEVQGLNGHPRVFLADLLRRLFEDSEGHGVLFALRVEHDHLALFRVHQPTAWGGQTLTHHVGSVEHEADGSFVCLEGLEALGVCLGDTCGPV